MFTTDFRQHRLSDPAAYKLATATHWTRQDVSSQAGAVAECNDLDDVRDGRPGRLPPTAVIEAIKVGSRNERVVSKKMAEGSKPRNIEASTICCCRATTGHQDFPQLGPYSQRGVQAAAGGGASWSRRDTVPGAGRTQCGSSAKRAMLACCKAVSPGRHRRDPSGQSATGFGRSRRGGVTFRTTAGVIMKSRAPNMHGSAGAPVITTHPRTLRSCCPSRPRLRCWRRQGRQLPVAEETGPISPCDLPSYTTPATSCGISECVSLRGLERFRCDQKRPGILNSAGPELAARHGHRTA